MRISWLVLAYFSAPCGPACAQRRNSRPDSVALVSSLEELGTALEDEAQHIVIQNHLDFSPGDVSESPPAQMIRLPPSVKSISVRPVACMLLQTVARLTHASCLPHDVKSSHSEGLHRLLGVSLCMHPLHAMGPSLL